MLGTLWLGFQQDKILFLSPQVDGFGREKIKGNHFSAKRSQEVAEGK